MRILFIYPHPDDESFGPAHVMHKQRREGHEVYLLTLTRGGATRQRHKYGYSIEKMGAVRLEEMRAVEAVLGLSGMTVLDLPDSGLKEMAPQDIEEVVRKHVEIVRPHVLVSYPVHGISGFHDHLVTHAVVKRVFADQRDRIPALQRLAFPTLSLEEAARGEHFRLSGSTDEEIDCVVSVDQQDIDAAHHALDCYETFQETIEKSGIKNFIGRESCFEIFGEAHDPPLTDLFVGLSESGTALRTSTSTETAHDVRANGPRENGRIVQPERTVETRQAGHAAEAGQATQSTRAAEAGQATQSTRAAEAGQATQSTRAAEAGQATQSTQAAESVLPMESENLPDLAPGVLPRKVRVAEYYYRHEAELARTVLEASGIAAYVLSDDAGGQAVGIQFTGGVGLWIEESDVELAREVLQSTVPDEESAPGADHADPGKAEAPIAYRPLRPSDAESCFRLRSAAIIRLFHSELSPGEVAAAVNAHMPQDYEDMIQDMHGLGAVMAGPSIPADRTMAEETGGESLVGFCLFRIIDETTAEIFLLYVDLDVQGRGVGRLLLEMAEEKITKDHPGIEWLIVDSVTPQGNQAFYERCGFRVVGEHAYEYPDGSVRAIRLSKTMR